MEKQNKLIKFVEENVPMSGDIYMKVDIEDPLMDEIMDFGAVAIKSWLENFAKEWSEKHTAPLPRLIRVKLDEMNGVGVE